MTVKLKLLLRVVQRRMIAGEGFEEILRDYPKLTEEELQLLRVKQEA